MSDLEVENTTIMARMTDSGKKGKNACTSRERNKYNFFNVRKLVFEDTKITM